MDWGAFCLVRHHGPKIEFRPADNISKTAYAIAGSDSIQDTPCRRSGCGIIVGTELPALPTRGPAPESTRRGSRIDRRIAHCVLTGHQTAWSRTGHSEQPIGMHCSCGFDATDFRETCTLRAGDGQIVVVLTPDVRLAANRGNEKCRVHSTSSWRLAVPRIVQSDDVDYPAGGSTEAGPQAPSRGNEGRRV